MTSPSNGRRAQDPDAWVATMPDGWEYADLKVVAYIQPGVWSEIRLSPEDVTKAVRSGTVTMYGEFDWTGTDEWQTSALNFDTGQYDRSGWREDAFKYGLPWEITHWATAASSNQWRLNFTLPHATATKAFEDVDPDHILARLSVGQVPAGDFQYSLNDVFVLTTDAGYLVKFKIAGISNSSAGWPDEYHRRWLTIQYVVYNP